MFPVWAKAAPATRSEMAARRVRFMAISDFTLIPELLEAIQYSALRRGLRFGVVFEAVVFDDGGRVAAGEGVSDVVSRELADRGGRLAHARRTPRGVVRVAGDEVHHLALDPLPGA